MSPQPSAAAEKWRRMSINVAPSASRRASLYHISCRGLIDIFNNVNDADAHRVVGATRDKHQSALDAASNRRLMAAAALRITRISVWRKANQHRRCSIL